jgi:hypothetical protein
MNTIVAFVLCMAAWAATCVVYVQFMVWYDAHTRRRAVARRRALRELAR